ncbi:3-phenylpropionate/cinnamic acid dioxygenase subunit beta [Brevibacillus centrosporus]|nr:3-phenylpropionate/cinnamic acid dioxygenase subunit beta [Brevibacillus centrosporus]MED4910943.1 3-phenylpropionate/cinnamic acid dioxygenase subunit beta [Brevibacillus centrosporus]
MDSTRKDGSTKEEMAMNTDLYYEITQFYYREAYLLDARKFEEWLEILTDDIRYRMPLRATREKKDGSNIVEAMTFFEETKTSLTTRVKRLGTSSAWAEDPAPRTRHFITNILLETVSEDDKLTVRSHFLFKRSRAQDVGTEELFGERLDVLQKSGGTWKIASRTIYPDQTVLSVMNLSMFL